MVDDAKDEAWSIPTPAFNAQDALTKLKRSLRNAKLGERGAANAPWFELRGKAVIRVVLQGQELHVSLAKKRAVTPEWERSTITSNEQLRKLETDVNKRLARWDQED